MVKQANIAQLGSFRSPVWMEEGWSGLQCGVDLIREHVKPELDKHSPNQSYLGLGIHNTYHILTAIDCN